jgi:hypothetical protein
VDFTYYFAGFFGALTMIASHVIRFLTKSPLTTTWSGVTLAVAVSLSFFLSINWSHLLDWGAAFAAIDLSIIAIATIVGCIIAGPYTALLILKRRRHF